MAGGASPEDAIRAVVTDPGIGLARYIADPDSRLNTPARRARAIANLLQRGAPQLLATAQQSVVSQMGSRASAVAQVVLEMAEGRMSGRDMRTKDDAAIARERREAAVFLLESIGVGPKSRASGGSSTTVNVGIQTAAQNTAAHIESAQMAETIARRRTALQWAVEVLAASAPAADVELVRSKLAEVGVVIRGRGRRDVGETIEVAAESVEVVPS